MPEEKMTAAVGSVPVPDPTLATREALLRDIKALQDILEAKLHGMEKSIESLETLINTKIDAVINKSDERHKGVQLQFAERDTRSDQLVNAAMTMWRTTATQIEEKTANLQALHHERFLSVDKQFEQNSVALISTLTATKETFREQTSAASMAIAKSEAATAKQLDALQASQQLSLAGIESKISDLKDRVTSIEQRTAGQIAQRGETQGSQIQWVGIMGLVLGAVVGLGGVIMAMSNDPVPLPIPERVVIEQVPATTGGIR